MSKHPFGVIFSEIALGGALFLNPGDSRFPGVEELVGELAVCFSGEVFPLRLGEAVLRLAYISVSLATPTVQVV